MTTSFRSIIFALFVVQFGIADGPFGLEAGSSLIQIQNQLGQKNVVKKRDNTYNLVVVPKPHPLFKEYYIVIDDKFGLVKIGAWTQNIENDAYGSETKSIYNQIKQALVNNYGQCGEYDFLKAGSIWNQPREWMMALKTQNRVLVAFWPLSGGTKLKNNVNTILLEAIAFSMDTGAINLSYEFQDFLAVAGERKKADESVF